MQLVAGQRVRLKNDIFTYFGPDAAYAVERFRERGCKILERPTGYLVRDACAGDIGTVIETYPMLAQVTCQFPLVVSDAHPDELELLS